MKSTAIVLACVTLFLGTGVRQFASAQDPTKPVSAKTLLRTTLDKGFAPGREVFIDIVEVPPNTTMARHWHPGEEFQYVLEGDATVMLDGKTPFKIKAGETGHMPFKAVHAVKSGSRGVKVVVFRVHTEGEQIRFPASDGH